MKTYEYVILSAFYSHYICLDVKWLNYKKQNERENDKIYVEESLEKML